MTESIDWLTNTTLAGIPLLNWLMAAGAALLAYLIMTGALALLLRRLRPIAEHSRTRIDDVVADTLAATSKPLLALVALLIGVGLLDLPERWSSRVSMLWFAVLALQIGLWGHRAVAEGLALYLARRSGTQPELHGAATVLMSLGLRTALWSVVLLAILSNVGVDITAFVASLGVGGIAIALAAQNILGDLFASLSIAIDKPFEVGDSIRVDTLDGTVEHVGLKSTRIRSLGGEQIVISNTDLLGERIRNFKRLDERRIVFAFGVTYDISPDQAAEIPARVQRIVEASPRLRFDRAHLKTFGESSIDYEVVYYVLESGYRVYMDEQQRINLALMRELASMGVEFAFPTRTVIVQQAGSPLDGDDGPRRAAVVPSH